jgi:hypothetical protein
LRLTAEDCGGHARRNSFGCRYLWDDFLDDFLDGFLAGFLAGFQSAAEGFLR